VGREALGARAAARSTIRDACTLVPHDPGLMRELLPGTVTFLFTDIEGSTRLLGEFGDAYADELAGHRRALRQAFARHGGVEVDTQGDAFFVAFADPSEALAAAREAQAALDAGPIRVRMGLHTGTPTVTDEGYVGIDVHRAARICSAGHGGQVLVSETTRALLPDDDVLLDLGEQRLKDVGEPIRLYQAGEGKFPRLKVLYRSTLPAQPSPLVGRRQDLEASGDLLARNRLVTLTGPGGSGKTRLALQIAADAAEAFPDGVYWVPLQALVDPALVLPTIAQSLGAKEDLVEHIAERRMLVVLDNLEQLLTAAGDIARLLSDTPNLKMLATSREPLRIAGEREYSVEPLPLAEAVELFRERALLAEPVDAIREICRRVDCLPLAVELAAARTNVLAPDELLARLERRLPLLKGRRRDAPERQRTLQATIAWSYDLLGVDEQRIFRHLSVFAGSFALEAAEAVVGADLDAVASLVDKNLVRRWESGRFGMLETVHEYASERLAEAGEGDLLRRSHAQYFANGAEEANRVLMYEADASAAWALADADRENFRSAANWAGEASEAELQVRFGHALRSFWAGSGYAGECRRWLEEALGSGVPLADVTRARALAALGWLARIQGAVPASARYHEEALELYRSLGEDEGVARCLVALGWVALLRGDSEAASSAFEQGLDLARSAGSRPVERGATSALINLHVRRGELDQVEALADALLGTTAERRSPQSILPLVAKSYVALARDNVGTALAYAKEALQRAREIGSKSQVWACLEALASALAAHGDARRAALVLGHCDSLRRSVGIHLEAYEIGLHDRTAASLRDVLGDDGLGRLAAEGASMTLEDVADDALTAA